jgi:hypothetical protein
MSTSEVKSWQGSQPSPKGRRFRKAFFGIAIAGIGTVFLVVGALHQSGILPIHRVFRSFSAPFRAPQIADIANPIRYERPRFSFSYPANWRLDTKDQHFDPDEFLVLDAPRHGQVGLQIAHVDVDTADAVEQIAARYAIPGLQIQRRSEFDSWGQFHGSGLTLSGSLLGDKFQIRIFAHSGPSGSVIVWEYWWDGPHSINATGFDLIENSFQFSLPALAIPE